MARLEDPPRANPFVACDTGVKSAVVDHRRLSPPWHGSCPPVGRQPYAGLLCGALPRTVASTVELVASGGPTHRREVRGRAQRTTAQQKSCLPPVVANDDIPMEGLLKGGWGPSVTGSTAALQWRIRVYRRPQ